MKRIENSFFKHWENCLEMGLTGKENTVSNTSTFTSSLCYYYILLDASPFSYTHLSWNLLPPSLDPPLLPVLLSCLSPPLLVSPFASLASPFFSLPVTSFLAVFPLSLTHFSLFLLPSFLSVNSPFSPSHLPSMAAPGCWCKAVKQSRKGTDWGLISDVLLLSEMDRKDCSALSTFINALGWGNNTRDAWSMDSDNYLDRLGCLSSLGHDSQSLLSAVWWSSWHRLDFMPCFLKNS